MTTSDTPTITAEAAGAWRLGDRTVNRIGFGAMRLTANGLRFTTDELARLEAVHQGG